MDTEWNDTLRKFGIANPHASQNGAVTEGQIVDLLEDSICRTFKEKTIEERTLEELEEMDDDQNIEDDRVIQLYREKRMKELKTKQSLEKFGDLVPVTAHEFIGQVTKASESCWVVVHLFQPSLPISKVVNEKLQLLAKKFKATKFVKIVSTDCIPNYPDKNLPTLLIYHAGKIQKQLIGIADIGGEAGHVKEEAMEWILKKIGAVEGDSEKMPAQTKKSSSIFGFSNSLIDDEDSSDD